MRHKIPENFIKKLRSKSWRLDNCYYIVNKQKKRQLFSMNKAQRFLHEQGGQFNDVLKARQLGISTYALIDCLDDACFSRNQTICILAHEQDAIKKLFRIVRYAYDNMDDLIKPVIGRGGGSKYEIYFPEINSRIYCDLESRGDTISRLHISEYAFTKNKDAVLATIDAVPIESGKITRETTANGLNHFYSEWSDKDSIYKKFFFPWYYMGIYKIDSDPITDKTKEEIALIESAKKNYGIELTDQEIAWRRFKIKQKKSLEHFLQEFPEDDQSCFMLSGGTVVDRYSIQDMIKKCPRPTRQVNGIKIFKEFEQGKTYALGCDVSEGVGGDASTIAVICKEDLEQVAVYSGQIKPFDFAYTILELASYYSSSEDSPIVAIERNNHGHSTIGKISELLDQLYLDTLQDEDKEKLKMMEGKQLPRLFFGPDKRAGWVTNKVTRPVAVDTVLDALENYSIIVNDEQTLRECMTLVNKNGKIEAEARCHDDLFIALAIGLQMCINNNKQRNIRITGL